LRTEIQNKRKAAKEAARTERSRLQHDVDILQQRLTQELLMLRDAVNAMFNDRKMAVNNEKRAMDNSIQGLNYKITIALSSDMKGEVEGLRWVLTRRAGLAIAASVCMCSLLGV
jgi:hypothetical protein